MPKIKPIYTSRDAAKARAQAEAKREHRLAVKEARAKVKHWEAKFKMFSGPVQAETLNRMRENLAKLLES